MTYEEYIDASGRLHAQFGEHVQNVASVVQKEIETYEWLQSQERPKTDDDIAAELEKRCAAIRKFGGVPCEGCIEREVKYPGNLLYCTNCRGLGWVPKPRVRVKAKSQRWV